MSEVIVRLRAEGFRVLTRAQWGSEYAHIYGERLRSKPVTFPVPYGFVHLTVTNLPDMEGVRQVEQIGYDRFGTGISYNWVVEHAGHTIYEGQPLGAKGAHTMNDKNVPGFPENLNYFGHAVAFLGNVGDEFCAKCAELVGAIFRAEIAEGVMRENATLHPHREFAAKDCPGAEVMNRWGEIETAAASKHTDWFSMATLEELREAVRTTPILIKIGEHRGESEEQTLEQVLHVMENDMDRLFAQNEEILKLLRAKAK